MRLLLFLLILIHFILAFAFATVAPWRTPGVSNGVRLSDMGAPDEIAHANYVAHILEGRGLPILDPKTATRNATYEDHQPPLFYALDALVARGAGIKDVASPTAKFPLRVLNAVIGALGVLAAFLLGSWSTGSNRSGLGASIIVSLLPMNAALSGAVSNDPLLITLSTLALAFGARVYRTGRAGHALVLGLFTGLAFLTKSTGLLLLATFPFFLRTKRLFALSTIFVAALILPWLLRNQAVYGHPMAANAFYATFERTVDLASLHTLRGLLRWLYVLLAGTAVSTIGEFGYMDIQLPYALVIPILASLLLAIARGLRQNPPEAPIRRGFGIYAILLIGSYVVYNLWQVQPQARYLFPALGIFAVWAARGVPERAYKPLVGLVAALLLGSNVYALATLPAQFAERAARARSL